MSVNPEPLLVDTALLQQAETRCRQRVSNDPRNPAALRSLAEVCRKLGKVDEAAAAYAQLAEALPDDRDARYLHALFSGREHPPSPSGVIAAPFVLLKNVIPAEFHRTLLPLVVSVKDTLVPATVGNDEYRPDSRESLDLPNPLQWDVTKRFRATLRRALPNLLPRLNVPAFEAGALEFKLRVYKDGHFFRTHSDVAAHVEDSRMRRVSFVYFFHKTPRPYTGGDLLLFDSDIAEGRFNTGCFTRIVPEDNALVVFPSPYYHCVVPLRTATADFTDSRFVINGHLSARAARGTDQPSEDAQRRELPV
jgi:Rps23 Pro-64 3,4-dihydroxylase Tpa1-like proline 4-hydroxylase